jgi:release factor glutamine methyltransferase
VSRPEAYELGEWDFYNITLKVTPDVLIPRPDSEHVVTAALEFLRERPNPKVLDLCCGSGCIGLAITANHPVATVTYGDISLPALGVAQSNGCKDTRLLDALNPPPSELTGIYDALVCNPPYVALGDKALDASVFDYEPHIALFAGEDGLSFYRALLPDWLQTLKPGGLFAVEVGYDQAQTVAQTAKDAGLTDVRIRKDYAGHERVVYGYKR